MEYITSERQREHHRKWLAANPEKVREYRERDKLRQRLNLQIDPEIRTRRNSKIRELYKRSPESLAAYKKRHKQWRDNNKLKLAQYDRLYRAERPWVRAIEKARRRAKEASIECSLTHDWAKSRFTGRCEFTGLEFVSNGKTNPYSISLDRIDPTKGYTQGNSRFVLWIVNRFKGEDSDAVMIDIARAILEKTK
jgi:hypothetical protein